MNVSANCDGRSYLDSVGLVFENFFGGLAELLNSDLLNFLLPFDLLNYLLYGLPRCHLSKCQKLSNQLQLPEIIKYLIKKLSLHFRASQMRRAGVDQFYDRAEVVFVDLMLF